MNCVTDKELPGLYQSADTASERTVIEFNVPAELP